MAAGSALISGVSYAFTGKAIVTIAGTSVKQIVASGILSYDLFGVLVAPTIGVDVELIEWGNSYNNTLNRVSNPLLAYACF